MNTIKLGDRVKDVYTGLEGIASARSDFLYGCSRIFIEPTKLKDGKPVEGQWFDEQRVQLVKAAKPVVTPTATAATGGPQGSREAVRRADAKVGR